MIENTDDLADQPDHDVTHAAVYDDESGRWYCTTCEQWGDEDGGPMTIEHLGRPERMLFARPELARRSPPRWRVLQDQVEAATLTFAVPVAAVLGLLLLAGLVRAVWMI